VSEGKPLVLVVEDDRQVQRIVHRFLERASYDVVLCMDLDEVVAQLDAGVAPALVLCDWTLPGMTGRAVALTVRRRLPGTPVLYMSGFEEIEGIDPSEPLLRKPFRGDELVAVVRRVLEAGTIDVLLGDEARHAPRADVSGQHRIVTVSADELTRAREQTRRRPR
jgi:DNA-binding response OmpR family regulator